MTPEWLATVPVEVERLSAMWDLTVGEPFAGGQCSWVAPVVGQDLVLKIGWPHPESRDEALGLRVWDGKGAVRLHASDGDALLLERLGEPLTSRPEEEQDVVIAGLLRRLWVSAEGFRPLSEMCALWSADAQPGSGMTRVGLELWQSLPFEGPKVLLATDLHAGNVLAGTREPSTPSRTSATPATT